MYNPKHFRMTDESEIKRFIRHNSFGIVISHDGENSQATHLPLILEERGEDLYLAGHFTRGNRQWKTLKNQRVLVIFPGPHTYVSASWYKEEGTVPTWNYMTVHVYGICHLIEEPSELRDLLKETVDNYEEPLGYAWRMEEHLETVDKMINGIVGFRMKIENIEAKAKLNQNHPKERQEKVVQVLENSYDLYDSKIIAKEMKRNLDKF